MCLHGWRSKNSMSVIIITMAQLKGFKPVAFDYLDYSYCDIDPFFISLKLVNRSEMSKINLFNASPPQIPEVDNTLEEDSFQTSQQFKTNTISKPNNLSEPVENEAQKTQKNGFQQDVKMNTSQVMKDDKNDSCQVMDVQMTNQSQQSMLKSILESRMEEEIRNYFNACSKNVQSVFCEFKMRLATQITHKIKKQILKGVVIINDNSVSLQFKSKEGQPHPYELYKELQKRKQQAIQKIKDIEAEKLNLIAIAKKKNAMKKEIKPDVLTEEQKKRLAELLKQKRQFEKTINRKDQQLIQQAKITKLNDQKQRQKTFLEQNEKKKIKILQNLKLLELKSKQRQEHLKNSVLRENHDYTHKRYEKQWKKQEELMEKQQKHVLQQIHKKFELSLDDIKQHEKKYSLDLKRRLEQSRQKESRISHSLPKRQKTNFDRIIQEQIHSIKQKNQQEKLKFKQNQFKKKILQYQSIIDAKFKPKIDTSNSFVIPIQRAYSSVSLSKQKRVEIGLEYLAKAKELKKSHQKRQKVVQTKILSGYSAYKDYLKERQPSNYNISRRQFSELVRRPKQSYEQLEIAKNMAQGLEAKVKKNQDNKMYQSMKNKLLLLESLY